MRFIWVVFRRFELDLVVVDVILEYYLLKYVEEEYLNS